MYIYTESHALIYTYAYDFLSEPDKYEVTYNAPVEEGWDRIKC